MKKLTSVSCLALALVAFTSSTLFAQNVQAPVTPTPISLTSGSYSQNFDDDGMGGGLASTGTTSSQLPQGWVFNENGTGAAVNGQYTVGTGSSNGGDVYSFGTTSANGVLTDRAFGTVLSGSDNPTIGAEFINNTGNVIDSITVNYTGEQWRAGQTNRATPDTLNFQYSVSATALGISANGSTPGWTGVSALDFNSLVYTVNPPTALDGNAAANRTVIAPVVISGLNITNGATFWIRWNDFNATGSEDGLAVDDFGLSFTTTTPPPPPDTYYFTTDGVNLGIGATGSNIWKQSGGASNWSASDTSVSPIAWTSNKTAVFKTTGTGAGGAITVDAAGVTVSPTGSGVKSLQFDADGFTLSGGAITLNPSSSTPTITVTKLSDTATIGSQLILPSSNGLTKDGLGKLVLTGTNTYSGGTTVSAGTLQIGNGGGTGSITGPVTVNANSTIAFNRSGSYTFAGDISGGGTLLSAGPSGSTTILTGNITPTVANITSGTLQIGDGGTDSFNTVLGGTTCTINVSPGATLAYNRSDDITLVDSFPNNPGGGGTLEQDGNGKLTILGTWASTTTPMDHLQINHGTVQYGDETPAGFGFMYGPVVLANNSHLIFDRFSDLTHAYNITGAGTVEKQGPGNLAVTGDWSPTGNVTVSNGILTVGSGGNAGSITANILNNAALAFNKSTNIDFTNSISGSGTVAHHGQGDLTLHSNSYLGGTTVDGGGALRLTANNSLGNTAQAVTMVKGSILSSSGVTVANNITVNANSTNSVLAYWGFDNITPGSPNTNLGTFNTTGTTEVFTAGPNTIAPATIGANAASSVMYTTTLPGAGGQQGVQGTYGGAPDTTNGGWGTFTGSTTGQLTSATGANNGSFVLYGNANEGSSVVFKTSTLGYTGLKLAYQAQESGGTAYSHQKWYYSTDGGNSYTLAQDVATPSFFGAAIPVDMSAITALDNQSSVYIKVTFSGYTGPALSTANNRIDNVNFSALPTSASALGSDITSGTTTYTGAVTLNAPVALTSATGGTVNFNGAFSGSGASAAITKVGTGLAVLGTASSYQGSTTVTQGTLKLGVTHAIDTTSQVVLNSGTLNTGGFNQFTNATAATLALSASSHLDMGLGGQYQGGSVKFANSNGQLGAFNLAIDDYTPGVDHLFIGTDNTGVSGTELSHITFTDYGAAQITAGGEIKPLAATPTFLTGDANGDHHYNAADIMAEEKALTNLSFYATAAGNGYGVALNTDALYALVDQNHDGVINNADLTSLIANLKAGQGSEIGVPEPSTLMLGLLGAVSVAGVAIRRRRQPVAAV